MEVTRRRFLQGCIAASAAPAFIKYDHLMKLYVPKKEIELHYIMEVAGTDPAGFVRIYNNTDAYFYARIDSYSSSTGVIHLHEILPYSEIGAGSSFTLETDIKSEDDVRGIYDVTAKDYEWRKS